MNLLFRIFLHRSKITSMPIKKYNSLISLRSVLTVILGEASSPDVAVL